MFLYKRNNGYWYLQYKDEYGKWIKISTTSKRKSDALIFFKNYKLQPDKQLIKVPTISEFFQTYIEFANAALSKGSVANIRYCSRYIENIFGDINIDKVYAVKLEAELLKYYMRTKHGAFTIYRTLKSAFNKAKKWKLIKNNPFDEFHLPIIPKKLPVFINEQEFDLIISHISKVRIYQICVTAFKTGMRLSEILHLTWEQVDLKNKMINLNNSEMFVTKSKKPRSIPMCEKVYNIFEPLSDTYKPSYNIKYDIVFYKHYGVPYSVSYLSHNFKKALSKTGLRKGIKFHTLRHSFASMLVSKVVSLYVVKELLGHSDTATTQIYAHLESKSLKDAINLLN